MNEKKDELYMMMELVDTDLHRLLQSKTALSQDHIRCVVGIYNLCASYYVLCISQNDDEIGVDDDNDVDDDDDLPTPHRVAF